MVRSSTELPQIKEDDKFFSRLIAKENNIAGSSFKIYYGGAAVVAVPFLWESQPGTPKHTSSDSSLPPLTPPPSHHPISKQHKPVKNSSKFNLLPTRLQRLSLKKSRVPLSLPSLLLSSSWSSTSSSSNSSQRTLSSSHCIHRQISDSGFSGCNSMMIMKNAFLAIVGHKSARGTSDD